MRMRTSLLPNNAPKTFDMTKPMVLMLFILSFVVSFVVSVIGFCVFKRVEGGQSLKNL